MEKKTCNKCNIEKDVDWFYYRTDNNNYRKSCKECDAKQKGYKTRRKKHEDIQLLLNSGYKECSRCLQNLSIENFSVDKYTITGLSSGCRKCISIAGEPNRRKNGIKNRYKISSEDVDRMLLAQNNTCLICTTPFKNLSVSKDIHIDHEHKTGIVRGILCRYCNMGLGFFKDSIDNLKNAISYLKLNQ